MPLLEAVSSSNIKTADGSRSITFWSSSVASSDTDDDDDDDADDGPRSAAIRSAVADGRRYESRAMCRQQALENRRLSRMTKNGTGQIGNAIDFRIEADIIYLYVLLTVYFCGGILCGSTTSLRSRGLAEVAV